MRPVLGPAWGRGAALVVIAMALAACGHTETATPATSVVYEMRGVIERLATDQAPRQLIIRHEATPDMGSMAMPFYVDAGVPLTGLSVGDKVSFRYEIDLKTHAEHVTKLDKLPADTALKISVPGSMPGM